MSTRPIRVCQVLPTLLGGGTEDRIARLIGGLDRGHFQPMVIGFGPTRPEWKAMIGDDVEPVSIARDPESGVEPKMLLELGRVLSELRPEIVHVHNWSTSLYGIAGAVFAGVPAIVYGYGGRETPERPLPRQRALMHALEPHVDAFTAVSPALADDLRETWNVPRDRVSVIPSGIDLGGIDRSLSRKDALARFGLPENTLVIGMLSGLRPVKRIPDLIDAVARVRRARPDLALRLLIVGTPVRTTFEEHREHAKRAGVDDILHLPGHVVDPSSLFRAFDIYVNCSAFEGCSNSILQAMAARCPIVATTVGGTPDIVIDGENGILVPPFSPELLADAIIRLAADPGLRARLGAAGRARVEKTYTHANMITAISEFYRGLAARNGSRTRALTRVRSLARSCESAVRLGFELAAESARARSP